MSFIMSCCYKSFSSWFALPHNIIFLAKLLNSNLFLLNIFLPQYFLAKHKHIFINLHFTRKESKYTQLNTFFLKGCIPMNKVIQIYEDHSLEDNIEKERNMVRKIGVIWYQQHFAVSEPC